MLLKVASLAVVSRGGSDMAVSVIERQLGDDNGHSRVHSRFYLMILCCALWLFGTAAPHAQGSQEGVPAQEAPDQPTFAATFKRFPLPPGRLLGWCGHEDYIVVEDRDEFQLYDAEGRKKAVLTKGPAVVRASVSCNTEANILYADEMLNGIFVLDWRTQQRTKFLHKSSREYPGEIIALSPNQKYVAYSGPGRASVGRPDQPTPLFVSVKGSTARWSRDSSKLLSISKPFDGESHALDYVETVFIHDPVTGRTVSRAMPRRHVVIQGAFDRRGQEPAPLCAVA